MEKELGFGEISSQKLKTSTVIFLKSCMHFSDTVLALGIYVYTSFANSYVSKKHLILI